MHHVIMLDVWMWTDDKMLTDDGFLERSQLPFSGMLQVVSAGGKLNNRPTASLHERESHLVAEIVLETKPT
jgi:hypothetical protein